MKLFIFIILSALLLIACDETSTKENKCKEITCQENEECNEEIGDCVLKGEQCTTQECPDEYICLSALGVCVPGRKCENDSDCSNNKICNNGICFTKECEDDWSVKTQCGLNNRGEKSYICLDYKWVLDKECNDIDECIDNEIKILSQCGFNNNGNLKQICTNGKWNESVCDDVDECVNNQKIYTDNRCGMNDNGKEYKECENGKISTEVFCEDDDVCKYTGELEEEVESCGLNGNGLTAKFCTLEGVWDIRCLDTDICINNTTSAINCGLNMRGTQNAYCEDGYWHPTENCSDPDICEDGLLNYTFKSCGLNGNGTLEDKCVLGKWEYNNCLDNDVCTNGITRLINSCGLNNRGLEYEPCIDGQWNLQQKFCEDNDVCIDGTTGYQGTKCGLNNQGFLSRDCVEGQWINELCLDDDVCTNGTTETTQISCGLSNSGKIIKNCVDGQWIEKCNELLFQFGSSEIDIFKHGAVTDTGDIYLVGYTTGDYDGNLCNRDESNNCNGDIFITKISSNGEKEWSKQFGTTAVDSPSGIAIDSAGNLLVAGDTTGLFDGNLSSGEKDIFVSKLNQNGEVISTNQFGTSGNDSLSGFLVGPNDNLLLFGSTTGSFNGFTNSGSEDSYILTKSSDGITQKTLQFGSNSSDKITKAKYGEDGNIYFIGTTWGAFPGFNNSGVMDSFYGKLDGTTFSNEYVKQFGTGGYDNCSDFTFNEENLIIFGNTSGAFPGYTREGGDDLYLIEGNGTSYSILSQFGTSANEYAKNIYKNTDGTYQISGETGGNLQNAQNHGSNDVFVSRVNGGGQLITTQLLGGSSYDGISSLINFGNSMLICGYTNGNLTGSGFLGMYDAFALIKNR